MSQNQNQSPKLYYVYILVDPRKEAVFYVGKGKGRRPFNHAAEARRGCECKKCCRIRAIWDAGQDVRVDYVYEADSERDALLYEKQLIADIGLHRLCNRRPGNISTRVETWVHPGVEAEKQFDLYQLEQARIESMQKELEEGSSLNRMEGYWQKKIDAFKPLVAKPPPWLEKTID